MNPPFPSFLKTALLATALVSAGHVYAADADGIVVYNAQHESLTKSWIEGFTKETGIKVTLRSERMWDFLERLTRIALPRIRDFRGVPGKSFDGRGNYTLGLREQLAFPEIEYDKVDRLRGLEISIVTTAKTDEESKKLLELLGMPFAS